MKQKIKFLLATIMMLVGMTAQAATITVTWNNDDITGTSGNSFTKDGVTITADMIDFMDKNFMGGGTFTTTLGNFTKIEVTAGYCSVSGTGWSDNTLTGETWTGNASSVSFSGDIQGQDMGNLKFVFTIEPHTVAVTSVSLSQTSASMTVGGDALTLTATVAPDNATDKTVTWTMSDASVAIVADGVVTAVGAGTATITATATNGTDDTSDDKTATCEVTVTDPATKYNLTLADISDDYGTVAFTVGGNPAATQAKKDDVVTVSVAPNEGYSAKDVTVRAYTSWEAASEILTGGGDNPGLVSDITVTKNETDGTWSFTMPEANVWVVVTYMKNLQDAWIEAIADQTYTGSAIEPTIEVKDGETTLTLNTDYTVAYSNNTNAGEATVTITAVAGSDYSGTASKTFTIAKADITMTTAPAAVSGLVYSGEGQTLITAGVASFGTVLYSLDGTNFSDALPQGTAAGTYTVYYKVEGDANHNAFAAQTLTDALNAAKADVALKRITLVIPTKSYMARIDADKRQIENAVAGVKLYSVKSVTNTEVELTAELSVIAAEMPYFIYNDNDTEVEVSIVVSSEDADNVDYDSEHFKGTLVDKTFTDEDMEEADHYVLSGGSSFVWVKDAGTLAAGKCWIELIPTSAAHARALSIVHEGETTGISTVKTTVDTKDAAVYDLQGRRVMQPTKGLFIVNGKKVVIK